MYDTAFSLVGYGGMKYDTAEDYKLKFDKYNVFDKLDIINENIIHINEAINKLGKNVAQLSESIKAFGDKYNEAKNVVPKASAD